MEGISRGSVARKDCRVPSKLAFKELHVVAPSNSVMLRMDLPSAFTSHTFHDTDSVSVTLMVSQLYFI